MREKLITIIESIRPELLLEKKQNWIEEGMLDSFDIINLIGKIQEEFEIEIDPIYFEPDNFGNVDQILSMLETIMGE